MSLDTWSGTAPTAVDNEDFDHWLWRIMQSEKNKQMITRLEDTLLKFVHDDTQSQLQFPPRNAFHRRVCHAVARRFGLEHRLEEQHDPARPHANPGESVRLVLIKTHYSAAPKSRLAQLAACSPDPQKPSTLPLQPPPPEPTDPQRPATFLRRPISADGKLSRLPLASAPPPTSASGTALKNISEEDYQKARARIFKPPILSSENGSPATEEEAIAQDLARAVKISPVAKGPVEGSTGFERRRNRRHHASSNAAQCATSDKPQKRGSAERVDNPRSNSGTEQGKGPSRNWEQKQCAGRADARTTSAHDPNQVLSSNSTPSSASVAHPHEMLHMNKDRNRNDLQDPDFDRRYDKWAVRRVPLPPPPPPPQQVAMPIFSQLLYPYTVQAAPHLHPSGLQMRGVTTTGAHVQQSNMAQYTSLQIPHAPCGGIMLQHVSQGIVSQERNGVNGRVAEHVTPYDLSSSESVSTSHPTHLAPHQHPSIPTQVARKPSPAYGLDSTVDFPPLP